MRRLILHMLTSIDGFIADSEGSNNLGIHWDQQQQRFHIELFDKAGGLVYGRGVFEKYVTYWEGVADGNRPGDETEDEVAFAKQIKLLPKYVASNTLRQVTGNTKVLQGNVVDQIAELKHEPGGDLLLFCGPGLFAELTTRGLIDEYMLYVYPVALGGGTHLFRDMAHRTTLDLVRTHPFPQGVNLQIYRPNQR